LFVKQICINFTQKTFLLFSLPLVQLPKKETIFLEMLNREEEKNQTQTKPKQIQTKTKMKFLIIFSSYIFLICCGVATVNNSLSEMTKRDCINSNNPYSSACLYLSSTRGK